MFRHKTRSNADLSVLTADSGSVRGSSGVSPTAKTTSSAFSENSVVNGSVHSSSVVHSDHSSALRDSEDRSASLTTSRPFTPSVDSAKDSASNYSNNNSNSNSNSGSYAMGTAGTAGAPKGFKGKFLCCFGASFCIVLFVCAP